jgi:hypothetical protein
MERIKKLWQNCLQAVDYEAWPNDLFVATACVYAARVTQLLIRGEIQRAKEELWKLLGMLVTSRTAAEEPELLYLALCILDIGTFAWALAAYSRFGWALIGNVRLFDDIVGAAEGIWQAREIFTPHLSDALKATYIFMRDIGYLTPWRAFRGALKATNYMFEFYYGGGGWSFVYGKEPIGQVLSSSAMARLKEILRTYVRTRNEGGRFIMR